ncbi:MAG: DUF308 domain-containing protein [Candidatus Angelobacter sp.]
MDFWKDLPNISGILLTLIGTAMIFMAETSKWLEARRGTRMTIAIVFVVLGLVGIIAGRIDRKRSEREQTLAQERQRQLAEDIKSSNQQLAEQRQMLLVSQLAQEHMKGQLEGIGIMAGKIGQGTDENMKQLVGAINKMSNTGTVHALTNKQLCDRTKDWVKRARDFAAAKDRQMRAILDGQQDGSRTASTDAGRQKAWQASTQNLIAFSSETTLDFRSNYLGEAIYLRDEMSKRLPSLPSTDYRNTTIFMGALAGPYFGILDGADYMEQLARRLCPE